MRQTDTRTQKGKEVTDNERARWETQEAEALSNSLGRGNEMNKDIRILLVDGHELVRHGLRHMLEAEEDMMVLGDCAGAEEALIETVRLHQNITHGYTHARNECD